MLLQAYNFSSEYYFITPPPVGPDSSVKFIVWADSGQAIADGSDEWEWCAPCPLHWQLSAVLGFL